MAKTALYADFQACGLAHLVAVSGAHLVIVTSLIAALLRAMRMPRRASIAVLVFIMGSYLVVSGLPVSAVRATIMSSVGIMSLLARRRPSALNALGLGIFAIVASSPVSSISASFVLSALSTAGIVLFAPLVESWLAQTPLSCAPFALDAISLTLSSAVLSQPYACSMFHQLPLIAPVSNAICAPLFPIACATGLVICLMACLVPLPGAILAAGSAPSAVMSMLVAVLAKLPYASIPISLGTPAALALSFSAALLLWLFWPSLRLRVVTPLFTALIIAFLAFSYNASQSDRIVMLDVGQGDAFLVQSRGATLLIDTGNHDAQLLSQLAESGVFFLDAVLITHSDDDHCGSLDALERGLGVKRVMLASDMLESDSEKNRALVEMSNRVAGEVIGLKSGDSFTVGSFKVSVLWPRAFADEGGNADSICLLAEYDGDGDGCIDFNALFTGDAESEQLEKILENGALEGIDVLKVAHHGSKNAMTKEQLAKLGPAIALIGVGAGNRYGHPAPETIDMLESYGAEVYRSDEDGQVRCTFSPDSLAVSLQ